MVAVRPAAVPSIDRSRFDTVSSASWSVTILSDVNTPEIGVLWSQVASSITLLAPTSATSVATGLSFALPTLIVYWNGVWSAASTASVAMTVTLLPFPAPTLLSRVGVQVSTPVAASNTEPAGFVPTVITGAAAPTSMSSNKVLRSNE